MLPAVPDALRALEIGSPVLLISPSVLGDGQEGYRARALLGQLVASTLSPGPDSDAPGAAPHPAALVVAAAVVHPQATLRKSDAFNRGGFPQLYIPASRLNTGNSASASSSPRFVPFADAAKLPGDVLRPKVWSLREMIGNESGSDMNNVLAVERDEVVSRFRVFLRGCELVFLTVKTSQLTNEDCASTYGAELLRQLARAVEGSEKRRRTRSDSTGSDSIGHGDSIGCGDSIGSGSSNVADVVGSSLAAPLSTTLVVSATATAVATDEGSVDTSCSRPADNSSPDVSAPPEVMFSSSSSVDDVHVAGAVASLNSLGVGATPTNIRAPYSPSMASTVVDGTKWAATRAYDYWWGRQASGDSSNPETGEAGWVGAERDASAASLPNSIDVTVLRTNWYGRQQLRTFRFTPTTLQRIEADGTPVGSLRAEWGYAQIERIEVENNQDVTIHFAGEDPAEHLAMTSASEFVALVLERAPLHHRILVVRNVEKKMQKHDIQTLILPTRRASSCVCAAEVLALGHVLAKSLRDARGAPRWSQLSLRGQGAGSRSSASSSSSASKTASIGAMADIKEGVEEVPPHSLACSDASGSILCVDTEHVRHIADEYRAGWTEPVGQPRNSTLPAFRSKLGKAGTVPLRALSTNSLMSSFLSGRPVAVEYDNAPADGEETVTRVGSRRLSTHGWFTEQSGVVAEIVTTYDAPTATATVYLFAAQASAFMGTWRADALRLQCSFGGTATNPPWCQHCGAVVSPAALSPGGALVAFVAHPASEVILHAIPADAFEESPVTRKSISKVMFRHKEAIAVLRSRQRQEILQSMKS